MHACIRISGVRPCPECAHDPAARRRCKQNTTNTLITSCLRFRCAPRRLLVTFTPRPEIDFGDAVDPIDVAVEKGEPCSMYRAQPYSCVLILRMRFGQVWCSRVCLLCISSVQRHDKRGIACSIYRAVMLKAPCAQYNDRGTAAGTPTRPPCPAQ